MNLHVSVQHCFLHQRKVFLAQCNMNTGLLTRNFEFQNVTWTKSAESADRMKAVITENYGHVIESNKVAVRTG